MVIFLGYLAVSTYGITQMSSGLPLRDLVPDGSSAQLALDRQEAVLAEDYDFSMILDGVQDYWNLDTFNKAKAIPQKVVDYGEYVAAVVNNWPEAFEEYATNGNGF